MADIALRRATATDSEFAFQVRAAAFREYLELSAGWDEADERRRHERRFATHEYRVIQSDGVEVGVLVLARDADAMHLHQFFILPEHQGRGLGSACVARVLEEAAGRPVKLRVLQTNPRALRFYERLGFERLGETATHVLLEHPGPEP